MNSQLIPAILVAAVVVVAVILLMALWLSRYVKCGLNQVLIVSGRQVQRPDGTRVGFRVVKGGGTFVIPVIETVDRLSLDVFTVEMPRLKARTASGGQLEADAVAQLKIKGDDASILTAAEHFLNKNVGEIKQIVRPVLEKHLYATLAGASPDEAGRTAEACAARAQSAAAADLANMGLTIISFTLRNVHVA